MIFRLYLFFLFLFFFIASTVYATKDSVVVHNDSTIIKYSLNHSFNTNENLNKTPDTSLISFQQYNPVYRDLQYTLGNLGLSHYRTFLSSPSRLGFDYGMHNLDLYQFDSKQIKYYNTQKPYTELNVVLGSKKEQYFRLIHTQNITNNWNFGLNLNKIRSEGFYQRQATNTTGLVFHTNYLSKTKKYGIIANGVYNKLVLEENGGIEDDLYFEDFEGVSSNTIPVNLTGAKNVRNNKSFFIKQYYNLGKVDSIAENDSIYIKNYLVNGGFSHSVFYDNRTFVYEDNNPSSGFYSNILIDSTKTLDSTNYSLFENEVSWSNYNKPILYSISSKYQYIRIGQMNSDSVFIGPSFENIIMSAEIKKGNKLNYYWNVNTSYVLNGINSGDYQTGFSFNKFLKQNFGEIIIEGILQKRSPDYVLKNYHSNHFEWNYNFSKIDRTIGKVEYKVAKRALKVGSSISGIVNYVYFDAFARPKQLPEQLQIFNTWLQKDFKVKRWHLNNLVIYQKVNGSNVVRIPEIVSKHSLFYENNLFKKALYMQIGVDAVYFSDYFANAYMPATNQFYLQNEKKIGNYPYIDFFINFKVKHVRAFLKAEHLNAGLMGNTYYMVPHYPMPGRALKFGISWIFYD